MQLTHPMPEGRAPDASDASDANDGGGARDVRDFVLWQPNACSARGKLLMHCKSTEQRSLAGPGPAAWRPTRRRSGATSAGILESSERNSKLSVLSRLATSEVVMALSVTDCRRPENDRAAHQQRTFSELLACRHLVRR